MRMSSKQPKSQIRHGAKFIHLHYIPLNSATDSSPGHMALAIGPANPPAESHSAQGSAIDRQPHEATAHFHPKQPVDCCGGLCLESKGLGPRNPRNTWTSNTEWLLQVFTTIYNYTSFLFNDVTMSQRPQPLQVYCASLHLVYLPEVTPCCMVNPGQALPKAAPVAALLLPQQNRQPSAR